MKGRLLEVTYEEFINNILETRGRNGCGEEYHETHHIVPKCMGGSNDEENLIDLFAREHFEAHRLLALENPNVQGLVYAWFRMSFGKNQDRITHIVTPEEYEEVRLACARVTSEKMKGENNYNYGKHLDEETKRKISKTLKGRKRSKESIEKTAKAHIGMKHSIDTKIKMSESAKGRTFSTETKKKMSDAKSGEKSVWYGKHHTEASKRKISEKNSKFIYCVQAKTIYNSMSEAESNTNINHSKISLVCQGKRKTAGGYQWKYLYDQTAKDGTVIQGAISLGLITEEEALKQLAEQESLKGEN